MAQSETTKPQYLSNTKLSAEADSFVPGRGLAGGGGSGGGPDMVDQKSMSPQQFSQLPRYITSCYPFVQGDPGATPSASGNSGVASSGPGRPQAPNYTGQRMPAPHAGGYNFPGTRPPGPQNFGMRGMRGGMMPRSGYPGGHVLGGYPGGGPHGPMPVGAGQGPGPGSGPGPGQGPSGYYPYHHYPYHGHHVMHPPGSWGPPGGPYPPPPPEYGGQMAPGYGHPPGYMMDQGMEWTGTEWVRNSDRKTKKKKEASHMVSVGVQNEAGSLVGIVPKTKKPKTKTIILMDAAIQTDFSDEIANLTLAEKPNSLYRMRGRWADEYDPDHSCTTTDSEEVDSDSGYSSPLHRRNQINNGTHPVGGPYLTPVIAAEPRGLLGKPAGGLPHLHPPHLQHPQHLQSHYAPYLANMSSPASAVGGGVGGSMAFSYSAVAAAAAGTTPSNSPYLQNYHMPPTSCSTSSAMTAAAVAAAAAAADSPMMTRTGSRSNVASSRGSRASSAGSPHPSSSAAKTEPEDDGEAGATKKKRRRNRRRKKKSGAAGDDTGALSDEPMELRRAHSSSNVSRTSGDAASADPGELSSGLRFEDEEEFPNLLSAASSRDRKSTSQSNLSYSDILKTPASLSQENLLNSSQFHSSNSLQSDHEKSGGKESKNARKRRKRREMANRAAEAELAEITLEQQVLRELSHKHHPPAWPPLSASTAPAPPPEEPQPPAPPALAPAPPAPTVEVVGTVARPKTPPAPKAQPKAQSSGLKSKQPISLNIADMIDALEKQQEQGLSKEQHRSQSENKPSGHIVNILDSTAPLKRGKEREVPKPKKPSPLKKVILKEREEKKRMRLLDDDPPFSPDSEDTSAQMLSVPGNPIESDLSQDDSKSSSAEAGILTPMSAEMSPISQNSPISMSPLSPGGSPLSSGITSPIASNSMLGERKPQVVMKIHSRRFREYCTQILDKDIDQCCTELLQDLVRFQDRLYHKDPSKAKSKRRIVLGLREVTKHLRLRKIKVVIISPNLERIQSKGGLDEALNNIIQMCTEQEVPFVFALGRRALGRACAKLVPVSVVGVFNYEGTEENFHSLMDLTENARTAYTDMVQQLEKEQQENPNRNAGSVPPFYAHMGHSRTPSACSAISFTSSILSEPISENYPQSEPETDSRGYEIIREALIRDSDGKGGLGGGNDTAAVAQSAVATAASTVASSVVGLCQEGLEKVTIIESLDDIDEVHEESLEIRRRSGKPHLRRESDGDDGDDEEEEEDDDNDEDDDEENDADDDSDPDSDSDTASSKNDDETEYDRDTVRELPHIDSIHSSVVDLSTEILSQHSSKNVDLNTEVLSTHSSKTHGESSSTTPAMASSPPTAAICGDTCPSPEKARSQNGDVGVSDPASTAAAAAAAAVASGVASTNSMHKMRSLDKERIESWVAEAQQHIERLTVHTPGDGPQAAAGKDISKDGDGEAPPINGKIVPPPLPRVVKEESVTHPHDLSVSSVCDGQQQAS